MISIDKSRSGLMLSDVYSLNIRGDDSNRDHSFRVSQAMVCSILVILLVSLSNLWMYAQMIKYSRLQFNISLSDISSMFLLRKYNQSHKRII